MTDTGRMFDEPEDIDPEMIDTDTIDMEAPNPSRIYDYWLGGNHNFAADRVVADRVLEIMPGIRDAVRLNRSFLARAARFMAAQGIRQFLDVGSGIPTVGNLHEIVRSAAPGSRVVYVDREPIAVAHSQLLLGANPDAEIVRADLRDLGAIRAAPETVRLLDFTQPVGVFMLLILHFVPDDWDPAAIVARYRDLLAPGSYLAISHVAADSGTAELSEAIAAYRDTGTLPIPRTHDQVLAFFDMVEPGLVGCAHWRPQGPFDVSESPEINELPYAGVGRKP